MTMHLEGPWLSTTGKYKGKKKFRNAEEARKARELENDWKSLQKKWGVEQEEKKRKRALTAPVMLPTQAGSSIRNTGPRIPSLNNGRDMTPAVKAPDKVYTGTEMLGIGQMHKSNAVPIFRQQDAKDLANMRR